METTKFDKILSLSLFFQNCPNSNLNILVDKIKEENDFFSAQELAINVANTNDINHHVQLMELFDFFAEQDKDLVLYHRTGVNLPSFFKERLRKEILGTRIK